MKVMCEVEFERDAGFRGFEYYVKIGRAINGDENILLRGLINDVYMSGHPEFAKAFEKKWKE